MTIDMKIAKPFDLCAMLKSHGWFQLPPFYWDERTKLLRWATAIDDRPLLLTLSAEDAADEQRLFISGEFSPAAEELIRGRVRHILNLDLDLTDFYRRCASHPVLRHTSERGIGRLMRCETIYEDVFKSICGTNVQWRQAVKMISNIASIGHAVDGTDYRLFPTPPQIVAAGENYLKEVGRVGYRSRYLTALSERCLAADPQQMISVVSRLSARECRDFFAGFMGIGKVTARYLAALYGHFDELAIDSLVVNYMREHYFDGKTPSDGEIRAVYAPFDQWQYLAYWMEFIINEGWMPNVD